MSLFQAFQQRGLSDLYSEREGIMSRECAEAMGSAMGTSLAAGRRSVIGFSKSGWLRNQRVLLGSQVRKEDTGMLFSVGKVQQFGQEPLIDFIRWSREESLFES